MIIVVDISTEYGELLEHYSRFYVGLDPFTHTKQWYWYLRKLNLETGDYYPYTHYPLH